MPPRQQRTASVKKKKLQNRAARLAEDARRTDGTFIGDTDFQRWMAPPVARSDENLIASAVTRFKKFIILVGPTEPRGQLGCVFSSFLHKLFLVDIKENKPGDPRYPGTFLNVESNEQKTAAYLGYNNAQCLVVGRTGKWSRPAWLYYY